MLFNLTRLLEPWIKPENLFNSDCLRKRTNWANPNKKFRFDNIEFDVDLFNKDYKTFSPKLEELLKNIDKISKYTIVVS